MKQLISTLTLVASLAGASAAHSQVFIKDGDYKLKTNCDGPSANYSLGLRGSKNLQLKAIDFSNYYNYQKVDNVYFGYNATFIELIQAKAKLRDSSNYVAYQRIAAASFKALYPVFDQDDKFVGLIGQLGMGLNNIESGNNQYLLGASSSTKLGLEIGGGLVFATPRANGEFQIFQNIDMKTLFADLNLKYDVTNQNKLHLQLNSSLRTNKDIGCIASNKFSVIFNLEDYANIKMGPSLIHTWLTTPGQTGANAITFGGTVIVTKFK